MEKSKVDQLKDMMKAKKSAEVKKQETNVEGGGEQTTTDEITVQIKAAEDEAKAHYDKLLRVMAEFENFKKRIDRERMEHAKFANQSLICDLLPVFDDLDRVLDHLPKETSPEISAIVDGVKLIQNHFVTALSKHGLSPFETSVGKVFDPNSHEAIAHIANNEYAEGIVAIEHRRGFKLHDRIIRPAMVTVSKGKGQ